MTSGSYRERGQTSIQAPNILKTTSTSTTSTSNSPLNQHLHNPTMVAIIRSLRFAASKRISTISPAPVQRSSFHFTALRAAGKESALSQCFPISSVTIASLVEARIHMSYSLKMHLEEKPRSFPISSRKSSFCTLRPKTEH